MTVSASEAQQWTMYKKAVSLNGDTAFSFA